MDSYKENELLADVKELKTVVASQGPHIALLLGLVKLSVPVEKTKLESAIDSLRLDMKTATETKRQAKKLIDVYFP